MQTFFLWFPRLAGTADELGDVAPSEYRLRIQASPSRQVLVGFTYMGKTLNIYPKDAAMQHVWNGIPIDERSET